MKDDAYRLSQSIAAATGYSPGHLPANHPTTAIKSTLRSLARAWGITGTAVSDGTVNTDDLRAIYNEGEPAVARIRTRLFQAGGTGGAGPDKATAAKITPAPRPAAPNAAQADALAALGGALAALTQSSVDPDTVRELARDEIKAAGATLAEQAAEHFAGTLPELVRDELAKLTNRVEIVIPDLPPVKFDQAHKALPTILQAVQAGASPFLVGPAGSGKTTLAEQIAKALHQPFYMASRVTSEHKLVGYQDATGRYVTTSFRRAFETGGVFLFDEVDASDPDAMTAFNAALANGHGDFPDAHVRKHPDFVAIAAGNTYGRGADRQYVGRNQLDAATLDRFQVFEVDYDETLERALAGNGDWTAYVQKVRKAVDKEKVRAIVSPRASIMGARMLAAGMSRKLVEDATVWKGMADAERARVTAAMR